MSNQKEPLVPVEFAGVSFSVHKMPGGRFTIDLEGQAIPSLPGIAYGLVMKDGATEEQVQKLCRDKRRIGSDLSIVRTGSAACDQSA
ncbi:hypothetical protein [Mesorhizobium sp. BHbdii]